MPGGHVVHGGRGDEHHQWESLHPLHRAVERRPLVHPEHSPRQQLVPVRGVVLCDKLLHGGGVLHERLRSGIYTPGQIDVPWTDPIKADFFKWLDARPSKPPISRDLIEKQL